MKTNFSLSLLFPQVALHHCLPFSPHNIRLFLATLTLWICFGWVTKRARSSFCSTVDANLGIVVYWVVRELDPTCHSTPCYQNLSNCYVEILLILDYDSHPTQNPSKGDQTSTRQSRQIYQWLIRSPICTHHRYKWRRKIFSTLSINKKSKCVVSRLKSANARSFSVCARVTVIS